MGKMRAGSEIKGSKCGKYLAFGCNGKRFYLHRAIYFLNHGKIPTIIDHFDGDQTNNSIENLKDGTYEINNHRRHQLRPDKTSKYRGVFFSSQTKKWIAKIVFNKHSFFGGYYANEKLAAMAFDLLSIDKHGENAMTNFPKETYER